MKKFELTQYIRQTPMLFQKLTVGSDDDMKFITDTTNDPPRVFAIHNKLAAWKEGGHLKNVTDRTSSPFQLLQVADCRRVMLKFVDNDHSEEENARIRKERDEHMANCKSCFVTFSHIVFGGGQDYAFIIVVLQTLEDATENAIWDLANGQGFRALDVMGVKGANLTDRMKPGPCVFIKTGHMKMQGRIAAKISGLAHGIMVPGANKDTVENFALNIGEIDIEKFTFFNEGLKCYFAKVINCKNFSLENILHLSNDGAHKK